MPQPAAHLVRVHTHSIDERHRQQAEGRHQPFPPSCSRGSKQAGAITVRTVGLELSYMQCQGLHARLLNEYIGDLYSTGCCREKHQTPAQLWQAPTHSGMLAGISRPAAWAGTRRLPVPECWGHTPQGGTAAGCGSAGLVSCSRGSTVVWVIHEMQGAYRRASGHIVQ